MEKLLNEILENQLLTNNMVMKIKEGQEKMEKDIKELQEGQEEMRKDIKELQEGQEKISKRIDKIEFKMNDGFITVQELLKADENGIRGFEKVSL